MEIRFKMPRALARALTDAVKAAKAHEDALRRLSIGMGTSTPRKLTRLELCEAAVFAATFGWRPGVTVAEVVAKANAPERKRSVDGPGVYVRKEFMEQLNAKVERLEAENKRLKRKRR